MTLEEFHRILLYDSINFVTRYRKGIDSENFPKILCEDEWFDQYLSWLEGTRL